MGDSKFYFLVVWGLKQLVPGGRRRLCNQVGLSCLDVSITFTKEKLGTVTDSFLNTRNNELLQTGLGNFAYLEIIVYRFAVNDFSF